MSVYSCHDNTNDFHIFIVYMKLCVGFVNLEKRKKSNGFRGLRFAWNVTLRFSGLQFWCNTFSFCFKPYKLN